MSALDVENGVGKMPEITGVRVVPNPNTPTWSRHLAETVMHQIADQILADMLHIVPRDTGALADSLGVQRGKKSDKIGSKDIDYAGYVEMGTSKMAAEPYMRPSLYKNRSL